MPTNATGVPVNIDAIDANGNYRNIGTATSDTTGALSLAGNQIFQEIHSDRHFPRNRSVLFISSGNKLCSRPSDANSITATSSQAPTTMYIMGAAIAIIVAIAVVSS